MKNVIYLISVIVNPIATFVFGMYLSDLNTNPNIGWGRFILGAVLAVLGLAGCLNVIETMYRTIRNFKKH